MKNKMIYIGMGLHKNSSSFSVKDKDGNVLDAELPNYVIKRIVAFSIFLKTTHPMAYLAQPQTSLRGELVRGKR
jgi:hypothetical protein